MALTIKTEETQVLLTQERTFQVQVDVKLGEVPQIHARREQVKMRGTEVVRWIANDIHVKRNFPAVASETIAVVGQQNVTVTVEQLWATVASLLDRWAVEDRPELAQPEPQQPAAP